MNILALNGGSSSIKANLYTFAGGNAPKDGAQPAAWKARVDFQHQRGVAEVRITASGGAAVDRTLKIGSAADAIEPVLEMLWSGPAQAIGERSEIHAAGHRIVHGGRAFRESTRITPEVKTALVRLASFAPEHNRLEVEAIEAVERILGPKVPQVAVFDTAFHASLPPAAHTYPGPHEWIARGIRRYGFHGISHQYVSRRAAQVLGRELASLRMITCHLGNGCSLAAIRDGVSIDTTMGFTPLEGLMMGTRSGTVDPGILIHLVRHCQDTAEDLDRILNKESGLKGLSGISGDMREVLQAAEQGNPRAQLALEVYVHRLRSEIGAMVASLEGLDALVFTAGVGENCPQIRRAVCDAFAFLGMRIDAAKNDKAQCDCEISTADSAVRVLVVETNEEWEIARESARLSLPNARSAQRGAVPADADPL